MSQVIENKSGSKKHLDVANSRCVLCQDNDEKKKVRLLLVTNFF